VAKKPFGRSSLRLRRKAGYFLHARKKYLVHLLGISAICVAGFAWRKRKSVAGESSGQDEVEGPAILSFPSYRAEAKRRAASRKRPPEAYAESTGRFGPAGCRRGQPQKPS
jgi:hypothetical protein